MSQVVLEMSAKEAKLIQSYRRVISEQEKMEKGVKKTGQASKKAGKDSKEAFGPRALGMLKQYSGALIGTGGVLAAMKLITDEIRLQMRLQKEAADTQITLSDARAGLARNLSSAKPKTISRLHQDIKEISSKRSISQAILTKAMEQAVSASGGDINTAVRAVDLAAVVAKEDPQAFEQVSGAIIDMMGVKSGMKPREALGLFFQIASTARQGKLPAQTKNIPRSVINIATNKGNPRTSGALYAALTTGGGDVTGEESGTAAISLAQQLRESYQGQFGDDYTLLKAIRFLQNNPKAAREFLSKASFERKATGVIEGLLTNPKSKTFIDFNKNLQSIALTEQASNQAIDNILKNFAADPFRPVADIRRDYRVAGENLLTINPMQGLVGAIREELIPTLQKSGMGALAGRISGLQFDAANMMSRRGAVEQAIGMMQRRAESLVSPAEDFQYMPYAGGVSTVRRDVTPEMREQAKILNDLAERTQRALDKLEKTTRNLSRPNINTHTE